MSDKLPWDEISTPSTGFKWLRTDLSAQYRFWWGKSQNGWPLLLFELNGDHTEVFRKRRPKVKGLQIDIVHLTDSSKQGLILSLTRPSDADIFYRLCLSIIRAAGDAQSEEQAILSVLNHLDRWRDFLSNARKRLLSPDEIRGLFAEISMIAALIEEYHLPPDDVVAAWQGPLRKPQDFAFAQVKIEVKAFGGTKGNSVQISSEHQLQSTDVALYLVAVELFNGDSDPARISLNEHVRAAEGLLGDGAARTFRDRLAIAGYVELPDYDLVDFVTGRMETYFVADEFPAIRSSAIPGGISRVRYDLDLASARSFLVPKIPVWDVLS
ncbi:PD-(D/E)XK motif protein [Bradyrhizobium tropiciagri]|uniref:PD-(D/E)XK motif protein n=1 Tax=Bradyrhizobium tropiciagri TaxID=312253 RepID=UPI001BADDB0F|nr:PD-(D/E)XK motif protein [Bradyrhizobium tropiciagri]MBR0899581.1 PD-(D/E)XK motif protein [Bradyrhizobium tropiciagri]